VHLESGKAVAKSNRRELNAALDALQEEVSSLYAEYDKVPRPLSNSSSSTASLSSASIDDMECGDHEYKTVECNDYDSEMECDDDDAQEGKDQLSERKPSENVKESDDVNCVSEQMERCDDNDNDNDSVSSESDSNDSDSEDDEHLVDEHDSDATSHTELLSSRSNIQGVEEQRRRGQAYQQYRQQQIEAAKYQQKLNYMRQEQERKRRQQEMLYARQLQQKQQQRNLFARQHQYQFPQCFHRQPRTIFDDRSFGFFN
jgi:hypothetical protein